MITSHRMEIGIPTLFSRALNNANPHVTWITAGARGPLTIGTGYSEYGINLSLPPSPSALPTAINLGAVLPIGTPTPWNDVTGALAHAPMFAKADPRSIRYNSMIGVVNVTNPPLSFNSAGVIGSIWPSPYATPPPMSPSAFPRLRHQPRTQTLRRWVTMRWLVTQVIRTAKPVVMPGDQL